MDNHCKKTEESLFQSRVEPLDNIQFDHDEEIRVPVLVELRLCNLEILKKSHPGSSCYDLKLLDNYHLHPKKQHVFDLGMAFRMRKGWKLEIHNRSGLSTVHKIVIPGTPKIVDNDYRGNVYVCLRNTGDTAYTVRKSDRIAELAITRSYPIDFIKTRRINSNKTSRGTGCFGSTGR